MCLPKSLVFNPAAYSLAVMILLISIFSPFLCLWTVVTP